MNFFLIFVGKLFSYLIKVLSVGSGSTWPGHIALKFNKNIIKDILGNSNTKVIIVAGTNGKTTTGRLITSIIRENNKSYLQNKAGANLINGLASTIITGADLSGKLKKDFLIFESDENALLEVIEQTNPDYIICLDLFRDQLDRYGELDTIAKKWHEKFKTLSKNTNLILNADDPLISYLSVGSVAKASYFGLNEVGTKETEHGADSIYCPKCFGKLNYSTVFFSHLGIWKCTKCKLQRPRPDYSEISQNALPGTYNKYNSLAASLFAKLEGFSNKSVNNAFKSFTPAFGRQEKLEYKGKKVQMFLSKNPTSFNESLQTIKDLGGKDLLIILNDKVPDGLDVSWIWDVNFEEVITKEFNITSSGERTFDMALRLKYAEIFTHVEPNLNLAIDKMIENLENNQTLFILPNYSAMLEARKIITGKKIL